MYVFVMYYNQQSINLFQALCGSQLVCTGNVQYLQYLLFTSISYVQESFKSNEVNHG